MVDATDVNLKTELKKIIHSNYTMGIMCYQYGIPDVYPVETIYVVQIKEGDNVYLVTTETLPYSEQPEKEEIIGVEIVEDKTLLDYYVKFRNSMKKAEELELKFHKRADKLKLI